MGMCQVSKKLPEEFVALMVNVQRQLLEPYLVKQIYLFELSCVVTLHVFIFQYKQSMYAFEFRPVNPKVIQQASPSSLAALRALIRG